MPIAIPVSLWPKFMLMGNVARRILLITYGIFIFFLFDIVINTR